MLPQPRFLEECVDLSTGSHHWVLDTLFVMCFPLRQSGSPVVEDSEHAGCWAGVRGVCVRSVLFP